MISKIEKQHYRQVIQLPQWKTIENLANEMVSKLEGDSTLRDDQWETLKTTILKEGQIRGIRNFIQEIYSQAINE